MLLNALESPVVIVTVTAGDTTVRHNEARCAECEGDRRPGEDNRLHVDGLGLFKDGGASEVRSIDGRRVKACAAYGLSLPRSEALSWCPRFGGQVG